MIAQTIRPVEGQFDYIEVDAIGDRVALETYSLGQYVDLRLKPHEAVQLSRALVRAAAEALGVKA